MNRFLIFRLILPTICALSCLMLARHVEAQKPAVEYLDIQVPAGQQITVWVKPYGKGSPSTDWQQYTFDWTTPPVPLSGYQPFDIVEERPDSTYTYLSQVNICNWMKECRDDGKTEYAAQMMFGAIGTDVGGNKKYTSRTDQKVTIRANRDTVTIPYYVLQTVGYR